MLVITLGWILTQALLSYSALPFTCISFISYTCWALIYWQIWFVNILLKKTIPKSQELLDLLLTVNLGVHCSGSGSTGLMWAAVCLLPLFGGVVIDFFIVLQTFVRIFQWNHLGVKISLWEVLKWNLLSPMWGSSVSADGFSLKAVCFIWGFMHIGIELSTVTTNPSGV